MLDELIQIASSLTFKVSFQQNLQMATRLPSGQSERQLMLDRQSAATGRQLSQAQSPLKALVGGEPSL
jgi:hypothetical protein